MTMPRLNSFPKRFTVAFFIFWLSLLFIPVVFAAGPGVTNAQIETIRQQFFKESAHGVPGLSFDAIDEDFVSRLYQAKGALGALDRILAGDAYADINYQLGQLRHKAMLESWAEVVAEEGVRVELNDAGKRNGGRSDVDAFMYTDALELNSDNGRSVPPERIHAYLIDRFHERFAARMHGLTPEQMDVMTFAGDNMMMDWRMSKAAGRSFMARMNEDVARLAATEGAYFIPAAYKNQVYSRYLSEGRTTIITPVADGRAGKPAGLEIPDGVRIEMDLPTDEASLRYAGVPGRIDRNAALGVIMQNIIQSSDGAISTLKQAKYSNRWITGYAQITNLEKNYQLLLLEGRDGARKQFAEKLFNAFSKEGRLPPNIGSATELQEVLDRMNRVELDKIIAGIPPGARPANWSEFYKQYQPHNIEDTKTKLAYFDREAQEFKQAMQAVHGPGYSPDDKTLADHAEMMFMDKARQAARMAAAAAAKKTLNELFTRKGAARQVYLYGEEAAKRQIIENAKGLHAAMIYLGDETLIRDIVSQTPPQARQAVEDIVQIARAQRADILSKQSAVDEITRGQLEQSDAIIEKLYRDLGFDDGDLDRPLSAGADDVYIHQHILTEMADAIAKVKNHNTERIYEFLTVELPKLTTVKGFAAEHWDNIYDIGTLDSLGKVAEAWIAGDRDRAYAEIMSTIAESVPVGGKIFSLGKNLKSLGEGQVSPTAIFLANQAMAAVPGGAKYGALSGWIMAVYGLEQSLYKIGWHFIGQPAQSDAVSLILMGRMNAIPLAQASGQSAMPMIRNDEDWRRVKENAILFKMVPLPPDILQSKELRDAILRCHFMGQATQDTAVRGGGAQMREEILSRDYLSQWEYWLRRLYFYEAVHKEVAKTVTPERMKLDPSAPFFINAENREDYQAATMVGKGGVLLWNHEEAWLRYYFRNITLEAWIGSQREHGEVMNWLRDDTLQRTFYTGNWEKAVVDELVKYYREGEYLALAQDARQADLEKQRHQARSQRENDKIDGALEFVARAKAGTETLIDDLLTRQRSGAIERQKSFERLYWHPTVLDRFEQSLAAAVGAQKDDRPGQEKSPRLKVKIPRPVSRPGRDMPMEITIYGGIKQVPDAQDLDVAVTYENGRETKGKLPADVLPDDIQTLFDEAVDPGDLRVIEQAVTITVTSRSDPGFKVTPARQTVYCVTYADEADEEQKGPMDEFDFSEAQAILEQLQLTAAEAGANAEDTLKKCTEANTKMSMVQTDARDFSAGLNTLSNGLNNLTAGFNRAQEALAAADAKKDLIYQLTQKLAQSRSRIGALSEEICAKTDAVKDNLQSKGPEQTRQALLSQAEKLMAELKAAYADARDAYAKIKDGVRAMADMAQAIAENEENTRQAEQTFADFEGDFARFQALAQDYRQSVGDAQATYAAVLQRQSQAADLHSKGTEMLEPVKETSETARELLRRMEEYIGQVNAAVVRAKDCPDQAAEILQNFETRRADTENAADSLIREYRRFRSEVQEAGNSVRMDGILNEARATETVADAMWESLEDYRVGAGLCLALAQDLLSGRLKVRVPVVIGDTLESARNKLGGAGLDTAVTSAGSAPSNDLADTVAAQTPEAGVQVEAGATVTLQVYGGGDTAVVPNVVGLAAAEARSAISSAGLQAAIVGGDPAPAPLLAFTVQSQTPAAGQRADTGATVTIVLYGAYEAVEVPAVVGLSAADAKGKVAGAGLNPVLAGGDPAPKKERAYHVQSQNPAAGKMVAAGTNVTIVIYGDMTVIRVPNVVGLSAQEAMGVISNAGFSAEPVGSDPAPSSDQQYKVQSQAPAAGQSAAPGSNITIRIFGDYADTGATQHAEEPGNDKIRRMEHEVFCMDFELKVLDALKQRNLGAAHALIAQAAQNGCTVRQSVVHIASDMAAAEHRQAEMEQWADVIGTLTRMAIQNEINNNSQPTRTAPHGNSGGGNRSIGGGSTRGGGTSGGGGHSRKDCEKKYCPICGDDDIVLLGQSTDPQCEDCKKKNRTKIDACMKGNDQSAGNTYDSFRTYSVYQCEHIYYDKVKKQRRHYFTYHIVGGPYARPTQGTCTNVYANKTETECHFQKERLEDLESKRKLKRH